MVFGSDGGENVTPGRHDVTMTRQQLHLIEISDEAPDHVGVRDTRLDERTKAIGRAGLAQARAALAEAERRRGPHRPTGRPSTPNAA